MVLALPVFVIGRRIALLYIDAEDFTRRRNVWLALTIVGFCSPNFWVFAALAAPLIIWAGSKDANPVGLYCLLLLVIPSVPRPIPTIGINELFDLDIYRLLAFFLLLPAARGVLRRGEAGRGNYFNAIDVCLLAYGLLQLFIYIRPDSPGTTIVLEDSLTAALRRGFLFFLDVYLLYFVVSRVCTSSRKIADALMSIFLCCALQAPMAVYEHLHHWLLYADFRMRWANAVPYDIYLFRDGMLRAQVSAGHALTLGYLLAMGLGAWLYVQARLASRIIRIAGTGLLVAGLVATYSRGPWLTAIVVYFTYLALGPRPLVRISKALGVACLLLTALFITPYASQFTHVLPFMGGTVDTGSITYRQQLAQRALELILEHPIFGDPFVYSNMADMRQGQGIIDLVNAYAEVALYYGLVGLVLFLAPFVIGLSRVYLAGRNVVLEDTDLSRMAIAICACMIGTLVMLATASIGLGTSKMYYILLGLAAGFLTSWNSIKATDRLSTAPGEIGSETLSPAVPLET